MHAPSAEFGITTEEGSGYSKALGCKTEAASSSGGVGSLDLVSRLLFPTPESSYSLDDFPGELIWVPRSLNPQTSTPEECIPCIFLISPSARFLIFYLHSNAEDLGRCYPFCALLRYQFQVHVLAVEYPGYGLCPGGQADEASVTENANVAFQFIRQVLGWPLDGILIMGRSIGTGPALAIATQQEVYGVILVSPFLSVQEVCRDVIGPLAYLITDRFPNKDRVPKLRSPLLVVHGKKDMVVPVSHGEKLYEACRSRKRLVCPDSMQHNTNLHSDANFFVLPMLQFFSLPDYCFDELRVPLWAYDKRLSIHYDHGAARAPQLCSSSSSCGEGDDEEEEEPHPFRKLVASVPIMVHVGEPLLDPGRDAAHGYPRAPASTSMQGPSVTAQAPSLQEDMKRRLLAEGRISEASPEVLEGADDMSPLPPAIEDAAAAAVAKFLSTGGPAPSASAGKSRVPTAQDAPLGMSNGFFKLEAPSDNADELPEADDLPEPAFEGIFAKVPETRPSGPGSMAYVASQQDDGKLGKDLFPAAHVNIDGVEESHIFTI